MTDFFGEAMLNPYLIKVRIRAALLSPLRSGEGSLPFNRDNNKVQYTFPNPG